MKRSNKSGGFTLLEVSVVLLVLALLGGVLLPQIGGFNRLARNVKLSEDLGVLCTSLKMMLDDIGASSFFGGAGSSYASYGASSSGFSSSTYSNSASGTSGGGGMTTTYQTVRAEDVPGLDELAAGLKYESGDTDPSCAPVKREPPLASVTTVSTQFEPGQATGSSSSSFSYSAGRSYGGGSVHRAGGYGYGYLNPVGLLIGDGRIPGTAVGATEWSYGHGAAFNMTTAGYARRSMHFFVDTFANQLIHRDPTYFGQANYGSIPAWGFHWRGPYIANKVSADPWGNRYMANVFALHRPVGGYGGGYGYGGAGSELVETFGAATVCYSAGPNGFAETPFYQVAGWRTYGDDMTVVLAGVGGL